MNSIFVFLVVLVGFVSQAVCQNTTNVTNTATTSVTYDDIFGLDFLGWGFDSTYRDEFFALKPQLFLFTYNTSARTYRYPTSTTTYRVPDQVFVRTVGKTSTEAYLFTNSEQELMTLDLRLNLQVNDDQYDVQFGFTLDYIKSSVTNKRIIMNLAETSLFQLYLADRVLDPQFLSDVQQLPPTYSQDPSSYQLFLSRYGTHFVDSVVIGGSVQQRTVVTTENDTEALMFQVALNGQFQSATGTKVNGDLTLDFKQVSTVVQTETTSTSEIYGGDAEFTDFVLSVGDPDAAKLLFESWKSTLVTNPVTIRYRLVELWTLFSSSQTRQEICKAVATSLGWLPDKNPQYCSTAGQVLSGSIRGGLSI